MIPKEALELENRSLGEDGEATLAQAYDILKQCWADGSRDRDLGLRLMFISWFGIVEPSHLTGFRENLSQMNELNATLAEVHSFFEPQIQDDAELLYAFGLPAHMFWFVFDDRERWQSVAADYQTRYRSLAPSGLAPSIYEGRGAYGDYYGQQVRINGGY